MKGRILEEKPCRTGIQTLGEGVNWQGLVFLRDHEAGFGNWRKLQVEIHCCYLEREWRIVAVVRLIDTGIEEKAQLFPVILKSSYWQKLTGLRYKVGDEVCRVSASALQNWVWSWETNVYCPACSALSTACILSDPATHIWTSIELPKLYAPT